MTYGENEHPHAECRERVAELEHEIERLRAALAANICPECEKIDEEDAYAAGGDNGFHS